MTRSIKKLIAFLLITTFSFSMLTACGGKKADDSNDAAVSPSASDNQITAGADAATPTVAEPAIDLGGMEIFIGDWWSAEEPEPPKTQQEEDRLAYHTMIQEKYNFKMKQIAVADWGGMQETFTTSVMAGTPAAQLMILAPYWMGQPISNGLVYDLATLKSFDFTESKWDQSAINTMTYGKSIYGMSSGRPGPSDGVFWNKRLFEEAGLSADLPYDLQQSGEWTWDKFEEICNTLTRDTNNDGTIDTYAMVSFSVDLFAGILTSNDAHYIKKDSNGKFFNATTEPQFLEAMQYAVGLIQKGYEMPAPPNSNWDWFISAFHDAKVAMQFAEQYKVGTWKDMTDDWGFVLCPKPSVDDPYTVYFGANYTVIPSSYDAETAEKIAFAYDLWTDPTPGYEEDSEAWKENYYPSFRDERAVDETLALFYDPKTKISNEYSGLIYGLDTGASFIWEVYAMGKTPAEKLEENISSWQILIDDANK